MIRFLCESMALLSARMVFGDERVAEMDNPKMNDIEYLQRHSTQIGGIIKSNIDAVEE